MLVPNDISSQSVEQVSGRMKVADPEKEASQQVKVSTLFEVCTWLVSTADDYRSVLQDAHTMHNEAAY